MTGNRPVAHTEAVSAWAAGEQRRILAVAILASFVAFLDGSVVNLALPAIARDLDGDLVLQQWVVDSYLLTLAALILVAGSISDIFGRVRVLRFGLVVFGIASVLALAAPSGPVLIVARLVQGVGAAFLVPSSLALINSAFDPQDQPRAIGIWTAWTGTAFVVGPLVGGLAVDLLNWRWIFALSALPVLVTYPLSFGLSSSGRPSAGVDVLGAGLAAAGLTGMVFALIESPRLGLAHPVTGTALVVGLTCAIGFLWWQFRSTSPMVPMGMFTNRNFGAGNLVTCFVYAAVSMGMVIVALFLQEVVGFTATGAGLATLPLPLLSLFFAARVGALSARFGPRAFMAAGPLLAAAGFLLMRPVEGDFSFWRQMLPGLLLFGVGMTITVTPLTSAVLAAANPARSGIASALNNAVSRVSGLVAIAFIGVLAAGPLGYNSFHRLATVAGIFMAVGGVTAAIGIRNPPRPARPAEPQAIAQCRDRFGSPPGG